MNILFSFFSAFIFLIAFNQTTFAANNPLPAITKPIPIADIAGYTSYPAEVKDLITTATHLSQENLTYLYGSSNPSNKGMDCSGTIYYLLSTKLKEVPRQANEMYVWVEQQGKLYTTTSNDFHSAEFSHLKPGDLLFWSGTYAVKREPPITHVMLYLGKNKKGQPLMFGASDGRTYQGKKMWGVSIFDFILPNGKNGAKFMGYGCIPNLTCVQ